MKKVARVRDARSSKGGGGGGGSSSGAAQQHTVNMFLDRALVRISKEATGKKFQALRADCQKSLELLTEKKRIVKENTPSSLGDGSGGGGGGGDGGGGGSSNDGVAPPVDNGAAAAVEARRASTAITGQAFVDTLAQHDVAALDRLTNTVLVPLETACRTKKPRLMEPALDAIQKLMAYGYIRGETVDQRALQERKRKAAADADGGSGKGRAKGNRRTSPLKKTPTATPGDTAVNTAAAAAGGDDGEAAAAAGATATIAAPATNGTAHEAGGSAAAAAATAAAAGTEPAAAAATAGDATPGASPAVQRKNATEMAAVAAQTAELDGGAPTTPRTQANGGTATHDGGGGGDNDAVAAAAAAAAAKAPPLLITRVVRIIGDCQDTDDEVVQLQILKAFLTAVTSSEYDIHDTTLMTAIRTCYNIYLISRSPVNQSTAKATLTQMLHVVFNRMEIVNEQFKEHARPHPLAAEMSVLNIDTRKAVEQDDAAEAAAGGADGDSDGDSDGDGDGDAAGDDEEEAEAEAEVEDVPVETQVARLVDDVVATAVRTAMIANGESPPPSPVATATATATTAAAARTAKAAAPKVKSAATAAGPKRAAGSVRRTASGERIYDPRTVYNDCFTTFRALCKLSMKDSPAGAGAGTAGNDSLRSKVLALELLLTVLESSASSFRSNEKFIDNCIKKYLWKSLITNGVSSVPTAFGLSLSMFLTLIGNFKDYLKEEIGVFFSKIVLVLLESSNSTVKQKWMVVKVVQQICREPQTLVDLYINYDCDVDEEDIFERIVNVLSSVAQGKGVVDQWTSQQLQAALQNLALDTMVTIIRSLDEFGVKYGKKVRQSYMESYRSDSSQSRFQQRRQSEMDGGDDDDSGMAGASALGRTHSRQLSVGGKAQPTLDPKKARDLKQYKKLLDEGKSLFARNFKKGMKFFIANDFVENDAEAIAKFLRETEGLDKEMLGEYISEKKDMNVAVLYAYIDGFDFGSRTIDIALRYFLGHFKLPGESQKIDRIMEKFADRFTQTNGENLFANADAAYTLSYAMIMLVTDLHNPTVKNKMTKPQWLNQCRGINDGESFPEEWMLALYDRIGESPLKLAGDDKSIMQMVGGNPKQRQAEFEKEKERMVKRSQELMHDKYNLKGKKSQFYTATDVEHVSPMFQACCFPMLAAFSVVMEESEDPVAIKSCLEGFKFAIRVSSQYYLETERTTFVTSLTRFTFVTQHTTKIKQKNIDTIKSVIEIARTEGNFLQSSWVQVLQCFSHLERLLAAASGMSENMFVDRASQPAAAVGGGGAGGGVGFEGAAGVGVAAESESRRSFAAQRRDSFSGKLPGGVRTSAAPHAKPLTYEDVNSTMITDQVNMEEINRIYEFYCTQLDGQSIEDFVRALCEVSLDEIHSREAPRIFSLQKLVEVAEFNMGRIRIVWSRIWAILAAHFETVGCHQNRMIAEYAVDSLRQLAMKFLMKDELANFNFQKEFLKPFENIFANNFRSDLREFIIRCLDQMILARAQNIKSGWKSIFVAFRIAAEDTDEGNVTLAFESVERIMLKHFNLIQEKFFVACVNCLVSYGNNQMFKDISLKAIASIVYCADQLASGNVGGLRQRATSNAPPPVAAGGGGGGGDATALAKQPPILFTETEKHITLWWPLLTGLSRITGHPHIDVRTSAVNALFSVLNKHAHAFNEQLWKLLFKGVLLPIFDNVRLADEPGLVKEDDEWLTTTCLAALHQILDLFCRYFDKVSFLLSDMLGLVVSTILQPNESLARIGTTCFVQFILDIGPKMDDDMWSTVCDIFEKIFGAILPYELIEPAAPAPEPDGTPHPKKPPASSGAVDAAAEVAVAVAEVAEARAAEETAADVDAAEPPDSAVAATILESGAAEGGDAEAVAVAEAGAKTAGGAVDEAETTAAAGETGTLTAEAAAPVADGDAITTAPATSTTTASGAAAVAPKEAVDTAVGETVAIVLPSQTKKRKKRKKGGFPRPDDVVAEQAQAKTKGAAIPFAKPSARQALSHGGGKQSSGSGFFSRMRKQANEAFFHNKEDKPQAPATVDTTQQQRTVERQRRATAGKPAVPFSMKVVREKCIVTLLQLNALENIALPAYDRLKTQHLMQLLKVLGTVHVFTARAFELPHDIQNYPVTGLPEKSLGDLLLKMEQNALQISIRLLFRMFSDETAVERNQLAEDVLFKTCKSVFAEYHTLNAYMVVATRKRDEFAVPSRRQTPPGAYKYPSHTLAETKFDAYSSLVSNIIVNFAEMAQDTFATHLAELYPFFAQLIMTRDVSVREQLIALFMKIGGMYGIVSADVAAAAAAAGTGLPMASATNVDKA